MNPENIPLYIILLILMVISVFIRHVKAKKNNEELSSHPVLRTITTTVFFLVGVFLLILSLLVDMNAIFYFGQALLFIAGVAIMISLWKVTKAYTLFILLLLVVFFIYLNL
ncbi:hypothetical protein [Sporosarcina sp. JAI121]|uniref:hypothetical protein n=1 Tax=Sporosarcina sp. JAI121 TaxID=2723064 RepID=UPI0015C96048|nr:hypothetical protein [Sporosarcina sp. JAI121]NYF26065.1 MFS-type transporter involved in bile tolerance (Atg22 family) [Sporosarcina sp. JAI121]